MRFLFVTAPFTGHLQPLVPLAHAARAAGDEVAVAGLRAFAPAIAQTGLPAVPVGPDVDPYAFLRANRGAPDRPRERGYAGFRRLAERLAAVMAPDALPFARVWRPDAVVYDPMSLLGPLLARLLDVPAVRHLWGPDFTAGEPEYAHEGPSALAGEYGLDGIPVNGHLTIDPCPPAVQIADRLPRQRMRYVPTNGPAVFPAWLREPPRRRRICVTWGTTLGNLGRDKMRHVPGLVRALGAVDAEIVLAVLDEHRPLFMDLPPNVVACGHIAIDLVLPTCAAIVHQSGGGTAMTAIVHGVPQLLVPTVADQAFYAGMLVEYGLARTVDGQDRADPEDIAAELTKLLDDVECRRMAAKLRREVCAQPAPAEVLGSVRRLAAQS